MPSSTTDLHVVIGLGRSGIGAARLLRAQGRNVLVLDEHQSNAHQQRAAQLQAEGIAVQLACRLEPEQLLQHGRRPAAVVVSPGMRWDHPLLTRLRSEGIAVHGELVPAWRASGGVPWIGITGTNGKTTVTHLVSHLLNQSGRDAPMGGNVGHSAAELVLQRCNTGSQLPDWLVMEISSYQIESAAEISPRIGIWTTLTPDHLERHGTLATYRQIKRGLLERSGLRILNADDPDLRTHQAGWNDAFWITAGHDDDLPAGLQASLWVESGRIRQRLRNGEAIDLMAADCLTMPGIHNRQNMLMAVAAGLGAGLSGAEMEHGLTSFPGVPHRLERLRQHRGITYFNDSKATNYAAAEVALDALQGPLVVLAGGEAKQGDGSTWVAALRRQARAVVLYGAARELFASLLQQGGFAGVVTLAEGLDTAVTVAADLAQQLNCPAVLLSPACASFDQYSDFEARGEHFRALVAAL
ncbi:MAG: UDP-N-acetylmuramoyl-L-alanine--D-glutamate ligase [Synechococcaceae bacterium WB9_2_112]|nr:UDP-N-acetylmuramoyl-L-alanine--D-glutamate ligase [Synechococcaceae bacterium WB9_2_112]